MKSIQPIDTRLVKADPNAVFDTTLKLTASFALNTGASVHARDEAAVHVGKEVIRRIRQAMPSVQIATFPDKDQPVDPDYPEGSFVPVFQSVKDCDLLLFGTSTTEMGTSTPAQTFFDRFYKTMKQFDDRRLTFGDGNRIASVIVVGGCGAYELASEILCRLSSLGFILPANASVVYEDGTDGATGGTSRVMNSKGVAEQIDLQVNGLLRLAKLLKHG